MLWKIDELHADFHSREWQGSLELSTPENGIAIVAPNGKEVKGIFGISFDKPTFPMRQDCFVRQSDLIVAYPPRELRKFHVQIDYRVLDATTDSLLLETWISVQTYLLDNHPIVNVLTPIHSEEIGIFGTNDAEALVQEYIGSLEKKSASGNKAMPKSPIAASLTSSDDVSIALLNHPRDQFDTTWSRSDHPACLEARLFGHFMEKGVIRRARMRCLISSQSITLARLQETYDAFVKSPLPLTA